MGLIREVKAIKTDITHILFDLGGVYFDGDYNSQFICYVEELLKIKLQDRKESDSYLDLDLMMGDINIIEWLERSQSIKLSNRHKELVLSRWLTIWIPNKSLCSLVERLKEDYFVTVVSNLDRLNGQNYIEKGYLEVFDRPLFLSYENKMVKPDKRYWEYIVSILGIHPKNGLFIDDSNKNIFSATSAGFNVIKYDNRFQQPEDLQEELHRKGILWEVDENG